MLIMTVGWKYRINVFFFRILSEVKKKNEQMHAEAYSIIFRRPMYNELTLRSFLKTSYLLTRSPTFTEVRNSLDSS